MTAKPILLRIFLQNHCLFFVGLTGLEFDHELHAYKDLLVTISPDLTPGETEQIKIIGRSSHENIPFIINKKFLYTNDSDTFHIYNSLIKNAKYCTICLLATILFWL